MILEFSVWSEAALLLRRVVTGIGYGRRFAAISTALNYTHKRKITFVLKAGKR